MEVSTTPCKVIAAPDKFWKPYHDDKYDSNSSELDYFHICNNMLLWCQDHYEESQEDSQWIWYFLIGKCNIDTCFGSEIQNRGSNFSFLGYHFFALFDLNSCSELFCDFGSELYIEFASLNVLDLGLE